MKKSLLNIISSFRNGKVEIVNECILNWETTSGVLLKPSEKTVLKYTEIVPHETFAFIVPLILYKSYHICIVTKLQNKTVFLVLGDSCYWYFIQPATAKDSDLYDYACSLYESETVSEYTLKLTPEEGESIFKISVKEK